MKAKGYQVDRKFNIIYVRDAVCNQFNQWCDLRLIVDGEGKLLYRALGTSQPGKYYYNRPLNPAGVFQINQGQFLDAWRVGQHCGALSGKCHEALVQVKAVSGTRSFSPTRKGAIPVSGIFGINIHAGYGTSEVDASSAGCLTTQSWADHLRFMDLVKQSGRVVFTVTILQGSDVG